MSPLDRLKWLAAIVGNGGIRGGAAVRTATVLAQHCNQKTGTARPSVQTIANMAGLTQRAVRTGLAELENAGFLSITRSTGGASSFTNEYLLVNGVNSDSGVNDSTGVNSALGVNPSSITPEPQFPEPLNSSSPEQGIEQGKNKISASGDEIASIEESKKFYTTKRKRKLKGQQLNWFSQFWNIFDLKKGKTAAADAWIDAKVTEELLPIIIAAAKQEANTRTKPGEKGMAPKWAQGWLTERRWEDEAYAVPVTSNSTKTRPHKTLDKTLSEQSL